MNPNYKKDLKDELKDFVLPCDIFNSSDFKIADLVYTEAPQTNPDLGNPNDLLATKSKITPYSKVWDKYIKSFIGPYELIDIFRPSRKNSHSLQKSIIKFHPKQEFNSNNGLYPVFSRGFFKLWETLVSYKVLDSFKFQPMNIASLAEGLGGFVHCLLEFRKLQHGKYWNSDQYFSITLKNSKDDTLDWEDPRAQEYFKQVSDEHFIVSSYGADNTGNILKLENLDYFIKEDLAGKKCHLVTGDGGLGLSSKEELSNQEILNAPLFLAEIIFALHIQEKGGNFIIKIYDIATNLTLEILMLLSLVYEKVTITKPKTSRVAASEKYVLCEKFKGIEPSYLQRLRDLLNQWVEDCNLLTNIMPKKFPKNLIQFDIDQEKYKNFISNLKDYNDKFVNQQIEIIEKGLAIIEKGYLSVEEITKIRENQKNTCIEWSIKNKIPFNHTVKLITSEWRLDEIHFQTKSKAKKKKNQKNKKVQNFEKNLTAFSDDQIDESDSITVENS